MKKHITITLEIDPLEHGQTIDTDKIAVSLVKAMLYGEADIPYKDCAISLELIMILKIKEFAPFAHKELTVLLPPFILCNVQ